jgi:neurotrimin
MVDNPIVHSAPGMEVKLDCFVDSYPDAKIHWFYNGMPVRKNNLVTMMESDLVSLNKNFQSIFNVQSMFFSLIS